jgi:hypothetical protein
MMSENPYNSDIYQVFGAIGVRRNISQVSEGAMRIIRGNQNESFDKTV